MRNRNNAAAAAPAATISAEEVVAAPAEEVVALTITGEPLLTAAESLAEYESRKTPGLRASWSKYCNENGQPRPWLNAKAADQSSAIAARIAAARRKAA